MSERHRFINIYVGVLVVGLVGLLVYAIVELTGPSDFEFCTRHKSAHHCQPHCEGESEVSEPEVCGVRCEAGEADACYALGELSDDTDAGNALKLKGCTLDAEVAFDCDTDLDAPTLP